MLQPGHFRTIDEVLGIDHVLHGRVDFRFQLEILRLQVQHGDGKRRAIHGSFQFREKAGDKATKATEPHHRRGRG